MACKERGSQGPSAPTRQRARREFGPSTTRPRSPGAGRPHLSTVRSLAEPPARRSAHTHAHTTRTRTHNTHTHTPHTHTHTQHTHAHTQAMDNKHAAVEAREKDEVGDHGHHIHVVRLAPCAIVSFGRAPSRRAFCRPTGRNESNIPHPSTNHPHTNTTR